MFYPMASAEELAAAELARAWLMAGIQRICEHKGAMFYNTTKMWKHLLLRNLSKDKIHLRAGKE